MILTDYIVPSADELLDNFDFATDLSDWTDASGSWSWVSGGGAEYDNDGEYNPLTQDYTVGGAGSWYQFNLTQSIGATGTLIVEIRNSLGVPVYDSVTGEEYFYLYPDTYTFAILADNFDGSVVSVSFKEIQYRPPFADEDDIELGDTELLENPVFATDLSGWTDATSSWTWHSSGGAQYDNDNAGNYLTQEVELEVGWYRLGVQLSQGASVTSLLVDVDGVDGSIFSYAGNYRESYFHIDTDDTYTVRVQADDLSGYVTQVTLLAAIQRTPSYSINKRSRSTPSVQVYDLRSTYNLPSQATSTIIGKDAGKYAFEVQGSVAVGDESLQNGADRSVALGSKALKENKGFANVAIGSQAQRDSTGDMTVAIGENAGLENTGDRNVFIGQQAGQNASTNRSVIIGNRAGEEESSDDKLHIANSNTESLIKGDFAERTIAIGFDDLSDGEATIDLASSPDHVSLRARGGARFARKTVTGAYTLTVQDYILLCNATGGTYTITLPAASGLDGLIFFIKKTDSSGNAVTVDGNGSETIDGATTKTLSAQYATLQVVCDGSNWHILSQL